MAHAELVIDCFHSHPNAEICAIMHYPRLTCLYPVLPHTQRRVKQAAGHFLRT